MFSSRVPGTRSANRLAAAVAAHRAAGRPLMDLTAANPTVCGFEYPPDLLAPLGSAAGLEYRPEPFGLVTARQAVARDYERRGIGVAGSVDPSRIVLTASTSEAYSLLFKLLCQPAGDEVLIPSPSYPLFEHLTALDGVGVRPYALAYHGRWELDAQHVDTAWTSRTRAVLAVSPNNPTGSALGRHELAALASRCGDRGAALIVDEVFADYPLPGGDARLAEARDLPSDALVLRLGGLSKSAGLPQVKLGWILADGPAALVDEALDRLELICDTYLSVSTAVQIAAPALIQRGGAIREQILARIQHNHRRLTELCAARPAVELLASDGGWSAVLRVPSTRSEEELVLDLLDTRDTLVHPGFFFDFPHEAFVVVSLLPQPPLFAEGARRLMEHLDA